MLKSILFAVSMLVYTLSFSQTYRNILSNYYADSTKPGGVLLFKSDSKNESVYTGVAHVEKQILIAADTRFRMASVSKNFTAMALYMLIQDGKISFETPIRSIIPELPQRCSAIQIKHLLNHSSGLVDYENVIPSSQKDQLADKDVLTLVQDIDTVYFEAGTSFRYSNTAYCLLSLIVERVTNQSYEDFCKQRIFDKLNMTGAQISAPSNLEDRAYGYKIRNSSFFFADQSITSATRGDGGVYISAQDFAKWMDKNNSLFTAQFYADLEKYKILVKDNVYYSLGLFFTKSSDGYFTLFHSGESTGFHNIFLFQPQRNYGISLFTNRDDLLISDIFQEVMNSEKVYLPNLNDPLFIWLTKVYSNE
ncbi:serine hydrolase domain-containing protein [Sphingobacterium composti Ten et al. 2007 non Yoo et al. 2007]|uniref:serine hydrolase domain-containing protein n=1 Tax=Sphingobacterium composti TaxID=363260 RepID=UPI00135BB442|nr:serine hydrolase domain-containing protein [Sphingobacterium composti Ten et al. 2007 non Yoo et al. 2007]